jgi:predicted amidohydrolase
MLTVVPGDGSGHEGGKDGSPSLIDEIVREGARRMLAEALQAEVDAYIAAHAAERDENGRRLVVRNGYHQRREVLTSAGAIEVTVPRVNDKRTDPDTGERKRFSRRSCRPGRGRPRRSPRCCRCCTCMGSQAGTSCLPSASSWARQLGCRRR